MASQPANFNIQQFTDAGQLLVGGRLYTYAYGTTAQKTAYIDPDGTIPHTYTPDGVGGQYIALNARGELPAPLYLGGGAYDLTLRRADGSTVWTRKANGVSTVDDLGAGGASVIGYGADKLDNLLKNGLGKVVGSIAGLRGIDKSKYTQAFVTGYYAPGDGGGGQYTLDTTIPAAADNGGTVIVAADGGCWKLVGQVKSYKQFGAGCVAGADDTVALTKMINAIGGIVGDRGSLAISASLPLVEGLFIRLGDNCGANSGGVITVHSSVANKSTFDYFSSTGANIEHIEFLGVRFYKGRHVIRCNNAGGGYLAQANFENCIFQELDGYGISATNSTFVIDFHRCRFIRCGGVDLGYGVNILKFRQCGFEIMRREYIKMDGTGSSLPSASVHVTGCRCESVEDVTASQCFNIKGYGRMFNFVIDGVTYFENVYNRIGTFDGVRALNLADINLTNSDLRTYTITLIDTEAFVRCIQTLVGTVLNGTGSSVVHDLGGNSGGFTYSDAGTANIIGGVFRNQKSIAAGTTGLIDFTIVPTGLAGATVYSTLSGDLVLNLAGSKVNDGTPIYCKKRFDVVVRKMFGGNLAATFTEYASSGALSDLTVALAVVSSSANALTLGVAITAPTGDLGAGLLLSYSFEGSVLSTNENPITAKLS